MSNPPQQPTEHVLHVITGKYFIDYIYRQDINNVFTKADVTYSYDWRCNEERCVLLAIFSVWSKVIAFFSDKGNKIRNVFVLSVCL